jgi:Fur family peroxide stress response transcriptional regulator
MRKTRQKNAILEVLRSTTSHPTADWVYNEVRKEIPNISLGTVYRNLRMLCQLGEVLELVLCGSLSRFDARNENHYHFRCEKCEQVFDVDEPVNMEMDKIAARKTGFRIKYHRMEFYGLCLECQLVEAVGES